MTSSRVDRIGKRGGVLGLIDRLRYHELSRQGLGLLLQAVDELTELVIGYPGDTHHVLAGFSGQIASRVTLEQLDPQLGFERVDVSQHGRPVDTERVCCSADRAGPGKVVSRLDGVPFVHESVSQKCAFTAEHRSLSN